MKVYLPYVHYLHYLQYPHVPSPSLRPPQSHSLSFSPRPRPQRLPETTPPRSPGEVRTQTPKAPLPHLHSCSHHIPSALPHIQRKPHTSGTRTHHRHSSPRHTHLHR